MVRPPQEGHITNTPSQSGTAAAVHVQVEARLSPLLGPFTARMALKTFSVSKLGRQPEEITRQEVPALLDALRPMLKTLVGVAKANTFIEELRREFGA